MDPSQGFGGFVMPPNGAGNKRAGEDFPGSDKRSRNNRDDYTQFAPHRNNGDPRRAYAGDSQQASTTGLQQHQQYYTFHYNAAPTREFLNSQQQEIFRSTRQQAPAPAYGTAEDLIDPALLALENNNNPTPQQGSMQEDLADQGRLPADGAHPDQVPQETVTFQPPAALSWNRMPMSNVPGPQMEFGTLQQPLGRFPALNNAENPIYIDDDDEPAPAPAMQQSNRLAPGVKRCLETTQPTSSKRIRGETYQVNNGAVPEETAPQPKRPYLTTEDADKNAVTGGNRLAGNPEPTAEFTAQDVGGYPVTDMDEPTQGLFSAAEYEQLHGENWRELINPFPGISDDRIFGSWNEDYWNNTNLELPNIDDVQEFLDSISRVDHENVGTAEAQPPIQDQGVDKVATEPFAFTEEEDMNSLLGGDDGVNNFVNNDEEPLVNAPTTYGGTYESPREEPTAARVAAFPVPPPVVEPLPAAVPGPQGTIHFAPDDEDLAEDDDPIDEDIAFQAELFAKIAQMDREISKWQGFANASGRINDLDMQLQYQARADRCLQRKIALDAILAETFGL